MTIEPTQDDPSSDAPRERRAGSRLRRLVRGLVVAYLLYVAGFEAAVRTGVAERLANRRPHGFAVSFASAHSWFPFWATVSGVEARGQMPRMRWQMRLDRGSGWLSPLPLVGRRIRLVAAHAEGVELWRRRRPLTASAMV